MKKILLLTIPLILTGCISMQDMFNYEENFQTLKGNSLNLVLAKMGLPDNQYELGDSKVYVWTNSTRVASSGEHEGKVRVVFNSRNTATRVEAECDSMAACTPSKWDL